MEQKHVPGQLPLEPPSADIAQRYLDAAQAVAGRRERAVDRRSLAWLQIVNAVVTAVFITAASLVIRRGVGLDYQVVLFTFLVWSQLTSGMAQRNGMQWRITRSRWLVIVAGALLMVGALTLAGFVAFDRSLPGFLAFVPGAVILAGLGGYGAVQLARSSGDLRPSPAVRAPLTRPVRVGTILLGLALGAMAIVSAAPEGAIQSVVVLLIALMILAWILAARSDFGLPAIGAAWRWPHIVAFALSASVLTVLVLVDGVGDGSRVLVSLLAGAGMIVLAVAVSFVPGRDLRD